MPTDLESPLQALDTIDPHSPAPRGLSARESDASYPTLTCLDDRTRVIDCRDSIQWIVQRREGSHWRGLSFCRTREALIRDAKCRLGKELPKDALAVLQALPEWHL
jgi:hypothetical protein